GVGEVRGAHGTGDAAAQTGAGPDAEGGGAGADEVGGVHVGAVGGLGDQQGHVHRLAEPPVGADAELPHRLLVPEVSGVGQGAAEVDGVGEVEAGGTVVHQRHVRADVGAQRLAQRGVPAGVAPGVQLDAVVAEFQALVGHVEELLGGGERGGGGVGG